MSMSIIAAGAEPPALVPEVVDVSDTSPGWFAKKVSQPLGRRKLVRTVARLCDIARDHEANGLPAGSRPYCLLYQEADTAVAGYGSKWSIDRQKLNSQLPSLENLRKLAQPQASTGGKVGVAGFGLILVLVLPLVIGGWWALFPIGYNWILKHFGG